MAVTSWKGRCPCWVRRHALNHAESHPAVANSVPVPPIALGACQSPRLYLGRGGEQEPTDLFGFRGGNDSREWERWDPEVPAVLFRVNTDVGLLFSHVPPTMHLQGLFVHGESSAQADPQDRLWEGMPRCRQGRGSGHAAVAAGRGSEHAAVAAAHGAAGSAARDDLPSLLTFMPISISFAAFRRLGMLAVAAAGVRGWAGLPAGGCWGTGGSANVRGFMGRAGGRWGGCTRLYNSRTLAR